MRSGRLRPSRETHRIRGMKKAGSALPLVLVAALFLLLAAILTASHAPQAVPAAAVPEGPDGLRLWKVPNVSEGRGVLFLARRAVRSSTTARKPVTRPTRSTPSGSTERTASGSTTRAPTPARIGDPNGKGLIWTSTRDHLDMKPGNFSDVRDYPQGAEIYTSDLFDGGHVVR